jgi:hypothetical protein
MQREFGKRPVVRPSQPVTAQPTPAPGDVAPAPGDRGASDPTQMRRAVLAILLTVGVVGGMFLLPRLGQCDGNKGALGLDWCRLMKASVEGASRGVAIGRGTLPAGGH